MFKKLMVPVDLSGRHEKALKVAAEIASGSHGGITLLHIVEVVHGMPIEEDLEFYHRLETRSRECLNTMAETLKSDVFSCKVEVRFGERVADVVKFAAREGIDLIVLSSHPVSQAAKGADWLSLSYLISIGAPCNVLLIK